MSGGGTTAQELEALMRREKGFLGCWPSDKLPKFRTVCSLIINTDPSDRPGEHWIGLVMNNRNCFYFDPLGAPILSLTVLKKLAARFKTATFCNKQIQHLASDSCGLFVAAFIQRVKTREDYVNFVKLFSLTNLRANDQICKALISGAV